MAHFLLWITQMQLYETIGHIAFEKHLDKLFVPPRDAAQ